MHSIGASETHAARISSKYTRLCQVLVIDRHHANNVSSVSVWHRDIYRYRFAQHSRSISDLSQRIKDGVSFLRNKGEGVVFATISGFCLTLYSFLYQVYYWENTLTLSQSQVAKKPRKF